MSSQAPRRGHGGRRFEKPKDFKGAMKRLFQYMGKYRFRFFLMFIFAVASTIFSIIGPRILGNATTALFEGLVAKIGGTGSIDFAKITRILIACLSLYVVSALFSFIQGFVMTGISNDVTYSLRRDISKKMGLLPLNYFESRSNGEILSRITNDVDTLQQSINQSMTQLITSITTMIGVLVMMLSINVVMTLCALIVLPLSMFVIAFVMKRSQKYFQAQQKYLGTVNGQIEENFGGLNIVKAFNKEEDIIKTFEADNEKLYESAWKSQFFSGMMMPIMNFIGNLGYVMTAILGGYFAIRGKIAVGEIQSFFQYIRNFTQPIQQIAQVTNMLQSSAAASERIFEFLDEEEEVQNEPGSVEIRDLSGDVSFEHVQFGYQPDRIIINDFSAEVQDGQQIAIVGPTGAGKTTMVKLLMRFYDVNSGSIKVGGRDIRDFNRSELHEMFGMVLQDTWLFSGTIRENIRYGRLDATDEEVEAAAKAAHIHNFILQQPGGYDMVLDEETSNISQGQKQLLTIARAILANNKIMILDEATSSVDTRTEQRIQKAMNNLTKGRTSFVIAHRLSTIKNADLILVMKDGDIVEQGTHDELIRRNGFYADLYNAQFEHKAA